MVSRVCRLGCTVAVLLVLIAQPILAADELFLVVHKKIENVKRVKDAEDITVSIGIYNAGKWWRFSVRSRMDWSHELVPSIG